MTHSLAHSRPATPPAAATVLCMTVLSLLAGCASEPPDTVFALATARAAVAVAAAELATTLGAAKPQAALPTEAVADNSQSIAARSQSIAVRSQPIAGPLYQGTEFQRRELSGRGESTGPREPLAAGRVRLLYFTAAWCPACRANDRTLAALDAAGWQIGPQETGHIQTIDVDAQPALVRRYGVTTIPAWILLEEGQQVRRRIGVLDPFAVGRMFANP